MNGKPGLGLYENIPEEYWWMAYFMCEPSEWSKDQPLQRQSPEVQEAMFMASLAGVKTINKSHR